MKLRPVADNLPIQQALAYIQSVGTPPEVAEKIASERAEIQERVGNFRAHQEKMRLERDEYFKVVMAKVRAASGPRHGSNGKPLAE
jgi:hypothetical protein